MSAGHVKMRFISGSPAAVGALLGAAFALGGPSALAGGDTATKFNVFVPASVMTPRVSYLVVTNASPSTTTVDIVDDGADGDSDDTVTGISLGRGESYIVRPALVRTSSGQSGGLVAGLESNGRLSAQLARRAIKNAAFASWADSASLTHQKPPSFEPFAGSAGLFELLPELGPDGSTRTDATPTDLPELTNASSVAGADYLDESGSRVATARIVETLGEVYEHGKALCDRAGGSRIDAIDTQTSEDGHGLLRSEFRNAQEGTGESALEFKLYEQGDGTYEVHSEWLQEGYPKPGPAQRVLNVQVWSRRPGYEIALGGSLIAGLKAKWSKTGTVPSAYFSQARTLGGTIEALVATPADKAALTLRVTRLLEEGSTVSEQLPLTSATLALRYPPFLDATLELLDAKAQVLDRVWMSDGAWTAVDDSMWGGKTKVEELATTGCMVRTGSIEDGSLALSGCARVRADVSELAGVARHLGGGYAPLDLTAYDGVEVTLRSSQPVRFCIEQRGYVDGGQPCVDLEAQPEARRVRVPLDAFTHVTSCAAARPTSVETFTFVAREPGSLDLEVGDLVLTSTAPLAASPTLACQPASAQQQGSMVNEYAPSCSSSGRGSNGVGVATAVACLALFARRRRLAQGSAKRG